PPTCCPFSTTGTAMAGSPSMPSAPDAPREPEPTDVLLDTVAAQVDAIDTLVDLARQSIRVFDRDLSDGGWQRPERAQRLAAFLGRSRGAQFDVIVHDTRWLEGRAPRILALLATHGHAIRIWRTGPEARHAQDPLV